MLIPKNICFRKFINWERKGNFKNKAIQMKKTQKQEPYQASCSLKNTTNMSPC